MTFQGEPSPPSANLVRWWKNNDGIFVEDGHVRQWTDAAGLETLGTDEDGITLVTKDGIVAIKFDGIISMASMLGPQLDEISFGLYVVVVFFDDDTSSDQGSIWRYEDSDSATTQAEFASRNEGSVVHAMVNDSNTDTPVVKSLVVAGAPLTWRAALWGADRAVDDGPTRMRCQGSSGNSTLGAGKEADYANGDNHAWLLSSNSTFDFNFHGWVAEVLVYDTLAAFFPYSEMSSYLLAKFGITFPSS